jgi:hypothetical protein
MRNNKPAIKFRLKSSIMALIAEQLVEEWLNRDGFFTIRGIKCGVREIDILAIKHGEDDVECRHVEVQVSFRPIGYISKLPKKLLSRPNQSRTSAKEREMKTLKLCVDDWVNGKFCNKKILNVRKKLWPSGKWKRFFVYGIVKYVKEIELIQKHDIETLPFIDILEEVAEREIGGISCNPAGDIGELLYYYHLRQCKAEKAQRKWS